MKDADDELPCEASIIDATPMHTQRKRNPAAVMTLARKGPPALITTSHSEADHERCFVFMVTYNVHIIQGASAKISKK